VGGGGGERDRLPHPRGLAGESQQEWTVKIKKRVTKSRGKKFNHPTYLYLICDEVEGHGGGCVSHPMGWEVRATRKITTKRKET
jgi:hypothetical protein